MKNPMNVQHVIKIRGKYDQRLWINMFLSLCFASGALLAESLCVIGTSILALPSQAHARDLSYGGSEAVIYVTPGQPTQVMFPAKVAGGVKTSKSSLALDKRDNSLIIFASSGLRPEGESIIVYLEDKRSYMLLTIPASDENPRDASLRITDTREPDASNEDETPELTAAPARRAQAPSTSVVGLMREMVLIAEKGKKGPPPGYRRSNRYSGEVILDDGSLQATIDEMFLGSNYWAYVLTVENRLSTTQRINPATFRLDGTKAIALERLELTARPVTDEQRIARAHQGKVYIVTKARKR